MYVAIYTFVQYAHRSVRDSQTNLMVFRDTVGFSAYCHTFSFFLEIKVLGYLYFSSNILVFICWQAKIVCVSREKLGRSYY